MVGVWTSHLQRAFPSIRDLCTMDDLVEVDSSVASEANVCIMVPTAGEKMKNVMHVSFCFGMVGRVMVICIIMSKRHVSPLYRVSVTSLMCT